MGDPNIAYLALGDSYTIGEGVAQIESWPVQLAGKLRSSGVEIDDPVIIAKTGWTTGELLREIKEATPPATFGLVSLLIGVNNQYRGLSVEEYRKEFIELLNLSISFASGDKDRVFVLSIPDWSPTPFAADRDKDRIVKEIDLFNEVNRFETREYGIGYFDVTAISRQFSADPSMLAEDGLHPSGLMYALWVGFVFSFVRDLL